MIEIIVMLVVLNYGCVNNANCINHAVVANAMELPFSRIKSIKRSVRYDNIKIDGGINLEDGKINVEYILEELSNNIKQNDFEVNITYRLYANVESATGEYVFFEKYFGNKVDRGLYNRIAYNCLREVKADPEGCYVGMGYYRSSLIIQKNNLIIYINEITENKRSIVMSMVLDEVIEALRKISIDIQR